MKTLHLPFILSLCMFLLLACQTQETWTVVTFHVTPSESKLLPYSVEFPPAWVGRSGNHRMTLASEVALLTDVPDKLEPGQIIVDLSIDTDISPREMLTAYTSTLQDIAEFDAIVPDELNDRPAAYQEGKQVESDDQLFIIAVDMGENMRGLLTARTAEGELRIWRKTLIKIAETLLLSP